MGDEKKKRFMPMDHFEGERVGYVFATREQGTGYYVDEASPEGGGASVWKSLGLHDKLCDACLELGWSSPTPIQKKAIPVGVSGKDVIGLAETGSGKTGAFALPMLHRLLAAATKLYGVALAPTRELAVQILEVFQGLGADLGLRVTCVVGGMDMVDQALSLNRNPHVVVATPGRLVDHLQNTKGFSLRYTKCLILDEADRMLSMDFEKELDTILQATPSDDRLTMLFSATMTSKVAKLQRASLKDPVKVQVSEKFEMPKKLTQQYLFIPAKDKDSYLARLVSDHSEGSTLIFTATCASATKVALALRHLGFQAVCLHGQMSQPKRLGALRKFKAGEAKLLVATDVAARGLDIPSVDLVLNYDIPSHGKEYVHRVGRTARAGKPGKAIAMITQYDVELYQRIEYLLGTKLPKCPCTLEQAMEWHQRTNEAMRQATIDLREHQESTSSRNSNKRSRSRNDDDDDDDFSEKPTHDIFGLSQDDQDAGKKKNKFHGMKKKKKHAFLSKRRK